MRIGYSEQFKHDIANAFAYGEERFGRATAEKTYRRVMDHIELFIAVYPRTGRLIADINCYQAWIPQTPFVVFDRLGEDQLDVLALFHRAQDLSEFNPD